MYLAVCAFELVAGAPSDFPASKLSLNKRKSWQMYLIIHASSLSPRACVRCVYLLVPFIDRRRELAERRIIFAERRARKKGTFLLA